MILATTETTFPASGISSGFVAGVGWNPAMSLPTISLPKPAKPQPETALADGSPNDHVPVAPAFVRPPYTPVQATPELLEQLKADSARLESATPQEIIRHAAERYYPQLTMATAFGPEGCTILHMIAEIEPRLPVFNLDTGYQFKETLELRDRIAERYGIEVELRQPDTTVEEYESLHGGPLYKTSPDQCCFERKIVTLQRAAVGMKAWMSGIRRDQSPDRATAAIVGWDKKFGLVKISPLANWTKKDVWKFITDHDVPYNPLHDQGYTSIGCWPCTRAVMFGEDDRAGRWSGFAKTECGLHTQD
jgi:phosphoadenosine phosphosulfate reductase